MVLATSVPSYQVLKFSQSFSSHAERSAVCRSDSQVAHYFSLLLSGTLS